MAGFLDVQFPTSMSRGAKGGPAYRTTIVESASGYEQRNVEWDAPKYSWRVGLDIWDEARLSVLVSFFHAVRGDGYAFRFKDWSDYYVGMALDAAGVPQYSGSHTFATGDGVKTQFQLAKLYTSGSTTRSRKITRPVNGTVKIYVDGVLKTVTTDYTIDHSTGIVTFVAPPANTKPIAWAGQFDVPARFATGKMDMDLIAATLGSWEGIEIVEVKE